MNLNRVISLIESFIIAHNTTRYDINGIAGVVCQPRNNVRSEWAELRGRLERGEHVGRLSLNNGYIVLAAPTSTPTTTPSKISSGKSVVLDGSRTVYISDLLSSSVDDVVRAFAERNLHVTGHRYVGTGHFFELATTAERDVALSSAFDIVVGEPRRKISIRSYNSPQQNQSSSSSSSSSSSKTQSLTVLVKALLETKKHNGRMLVLEVRNAMVGSRHCNSSEWDEFYNFVLANGSSTLRINQGYFTKQSNQAAPSTTPVSSPIASSSSSSSTTTAASSSSPSDLLTSKLLQAIKLRIAAFADSSLSALMTTVGGICEQKDVCSREQWLAFQSTIERDNHIDDIHIFRVSADRQTWRLAIRSIPSPPAQQPFVQQSPLQSPPTTPQSNAQQRAPPPPSPSSSSSSRPARTVFVDAPSACIDAIGYLSSKSAIAIDCEGKLDQNEQFFLRLVQIGSIDNSTDYSVASVGRVFVFDMQHCSQDARLLIHGFFQSTLQSETVVKVFHDCRLDIPAICREIKLDQRQVRHIFDTQVAYQMLCDTKVLQKKHGGPRASINDVLEAFQLPTNSRKTMFHSAFDNDPEFWHRKQLSLDQIEYAADDVRFLCQLRNCLLNTIHDRGFLKWSLSYSFWYTSHSVENERTANDTPFNVDCKLSFEVTVRAAPAQSDVDMVTLPTTYDSTIALGLPPLSIDTQRQFEPEFEAYLNAVPTVVGDCLRKTNNNNLSIEQLRERLVEVIIDIGEPVQVVFRDGSSTRLGLCVVDEATMQSTMDRWKAAKIEVGRDNRVALSQTLHRFSVKRDRNGNVDGLTCRVGKHCPGSAQLILDVIDRVAKGESLLLLGPPGCGKTTLLREIASILADSNHGGRRVHIIDTSNEIAGDGAIKHRAVGQARRSSVPFDVGGSIADAQAKVMREVVQNHTPQVMIIDEISTREQCKAASSIRERGTSMVATAHGITLQELRSNVELNSLLGGFESVTIGDAEMKRIGANRKNISQRNGKPVFDILIELKGVGEYVVHESVTQSVDALLAEPGDNKPAAMITNRWSTVDGSLWLRYEQFGGSEERQRKRNAAAKRLNNNQLNWLASLFE